MRAVFLALLSIAVAAAPAAPALACVAPSPSGVRAPAETTPCCCGASRASCRCGCNAHREDDALRAEQACVCGTVPPLNHEERPAVTGEAKVRTSICVETLRTERPRLAGTPCAPDTLREYPRGEVRPPLRI